MPYTITIDRTACAAHGDCEAIAPELFRVDEVAVAAARVCPSAAIVITDETGARVFP